MSNFELGQSLLALHSLFYKMLRDGTDRVVILQKKILRFQNRIVMSQHQDQI